MSNRKNRERAEAGWIFRDGRLVRKEEWYAAHPTREMLAEEMLKKSLEAKGVELPRGGGILIVKDGHILDAKDTNAVLAEAQMFEGKKTTYHCTKCRKSHQLNSKVGKEHYNFALLEGSL
jgi:uncharacterized Zn ribbon protein